MRSLTFTFALLLAALTFGGLAAWRLTQGSLDALFGVPPVPVGERLHQSFSPAEVARIRVSNSGLEAEFEKTAHGWQALRPWEDRMDPRYAVGIIGFTLGLRVEDAAPAKEVDMDETGLREAPLNIQLDDASGNTLARYRVGRRTPWRGESAETGESIPTVFIHSRERHLRGHVYICTGDILDLFKENGRFLRDHRPFHFNPAALEKIRIRGPEGELTLGREDPQSPWRITKPLELRTDAAAVTALLEGLYELQAVRLADRADVTLPGGSGATPGRQISLQHFGTDEEAVLEIHPPASADAREALATVSDRPGTVFEIPIKPEPGLISLADVPLTVNDLRDPTLARLNVAALREIIIHSATGAHIRLVRQPPQPWLVAIDGRVHEVNEQRLFELLRGITTGRATGFETDAAMDLTPWGLDRPILHLAFKGEGGQTIELNFGIDLRGNVFVHRPGTNSVMRVDPDLLSQITIQQHEWRHARIWNVNRVDVMEIERRVGGAEPLRLGYDDFFQTWQAEQAGENRTAQVDPNRANYLLASIEELQSLRWLAPGDTDAAIALARPMMILAVTERQVDDQGQPAGIRRRELRIAPLPGTSPPAAYYGQLSGELQTFLLDRETVDKLAVPLTGDR